jgi:hypothetical protein
MELQSINPIDIYRKWKCNTNTFEAFIRSGPFVSLQTYDNFDLDLSVDSNFLLEKHKNLIEQIRACSKNDFIVCDLDFDDCTEAGFLLNNYFNIKPVISFNMVFFTYGLIGTKVNIENLVKYGVNLKEIYPSRYVLLCNFERYQDFSPDEYKKRLNNQYELCEDDLPYIETLAALGYTKVVLITKDSIKDDIQNYLNYIKSSSLEVEVIRGF